MSDEKQTAVGYLVEQLFPKSLSEEQYYHIEQAKAIEKQQIVQAYAEGKVNQTLCTKDLSHHVSSEQYYSQKYEQ